MVGTIEKFRVGRTSISRLVSFGAKRVPERQLERESARDVRVLFDGRIIRARQFFRTIFIDGASRIHRRDSRERTTRLLTYGREFFSLNSPRDSSLFELDNLESQAGGQEISRLDAVKTKAEISHREASVVWSPQQPALFACSISFYPRPRRFHSVELLDT